MTTALASIEERDLWHWVDRLTESTRRRVERDDGTSEHITVPSLWQQLIDPETVGSSGNGAEGRTALGSKPPLDLTVVDLASTIAATIARALLFYKIQGYPFPQTDRSLRSLTLRLVALHDRAKLIEWADLTRQWVSAINAALPREEGAPADRALRGMPCPQCKTPYLERREAGETYRDPVLVAQFRENLVRAIVCRNPRCGAAWFRGTGMDHLIDRLWSPDARSEAA